MVQDAKMETKGRISEYRNRLDTTLALPDLTNADILKSLIKKHLLNTTINGFQECTEALLERRTSEVSNFLDMLRSTSAKSDGSRPGERSHAEWKVKQDNEEYRVMYREGPPGTPFHTMLVEGYVDGTADACLCVSWETSLYKKWWPQYNVPAFKIISSECLHKMCIGEQISLVRMKVSWPLSTREALVHFFEFEYFEDDLIIVLLNTIDESESIDQSTHGYSRDMIPQAKDVVRIGAVGGFAIQKVNSSRSYFRTIANMDLKLDFVPPSLLNFISRQLIGSGFRLYQKAVKSVLSSDEDYKKAMGDPLYARIRDALYTIDGRSLKSEDERPKSEANVDGENTSLIEVIEEQKEILEEIHTVEVAQETAEETNTEISVDRDEVEATAHSMAGHYRTTNSEIVEERTEDSEKREARSHDTNKRRVVHISCEVEQALLTLDKVIAMVRERGWNAYEGSITDEENEHHEAPKMEKPTAADGRTSRGDKTVTKVSNKETGHRPSNESRNSSSSLRSKRSNSAKEVNHNKVAPASPLQNLMAPVQNDQVTIFSTEEGKTQQVDHVMNNPVFVGEGTTENNIAPGGRKSRNRQRKYRFCCLFHPISRQPPG